MASGSQPSMSERLQFAVDLVESSPEKVVDVLEKLQEEIAVHSVFSHNETIEDVNTKSLSLLSVDHFLAVALMGLPASPTNILERKRHVTRAMDLWTSFFHQLEELEILSDREQKEVQSLLLEREQSSQQLPSFGRDEKIARFKAKQEVEQELGRLKALQERRRRLGVNSEEVVDVYDEESLERSIALKNLEICKAEALENFGHAQRELPMIDMMVQAEQQRQQMQRHKGEGQLEGRDDRRRPVGGAGGGLQVTHITTNSATGQLEFRRQEVRSQVFRPGWNQPTMTLAELGDKERAQAIEREARQKQAEAEQKGKPQRYEQLVRDGMEDNAELVDASAALDRAWDDWKDENPRGSGNKRGDVGDRNF